MLVSCRLSSTGIGFLSILFPPEDSAFLTVGLPNRHLAARTLSGFPCSTRVRRGRGGCLLYSEAAVSSRSAQPRWSAPAASQRPALCPAWTSHRRSCSLRSIRRFTHVHPSGLPLARRPRMERERLRLLPWASHPAVTHDARQGGDGPADTGPDHTLIKRASNRCDHSQRATSRRTTTLSMGVPFRPARQPGHHQTDWTSDHPRECTFLRVTSPRTNPQVLIITPIFDAAPSKTGKGWWAGERRTESMSAQRPKL